MILESPRFATYHISSTNNVQVAHDPDLSIELGFIFEPSSTKFKNHSSANLKPFIRACLGF